MDSSPKNDKSVINYSISCHSKTRLSFISETPIKILLMKSKIYVPPLKVYSPKTLTVHNVYKGDQ